VLALTTPVLAQSAAQAAHRARTRTALLLVNPDLRCDPQGVIVKFRVGANEAFRARARADAKAQRVHAFTLVHGLESLWISQPLDQALATLLANPAVEYAEPDYVVHHTGVPNDPLYSSLYGMSTASGADINAPEAWDIFTGDPNFIVAVIDDGTNYYHPDLAANIYFNPGEVPANGIDDDANGYIDDTRGWDFRDHDNDPMTSGSHGTHTAGTIGAVGNNGIGVTGVSWRCRIMPLRFIGPSGGYTSDAILALQYATRMGAKVSNNSWGGGNYSQGMSDAISASRSTGHIFVAAAGNGGRDRIGDDNDFGAFYPASYPLDNVISVAATDTYDNLAAFSNYGAATVDLGAPGVNILSCALDTYGYDSGTSMAAPHVTGVVALVYSRNPTWTYSQVRAQVLGTARPTAALSGRTATGGVVNAAAALTAFGLPGAPSGVEASLLGGLVTIHWIDLSSNETRFEVQRQECSDQRWIGTTTVVITGSSATQATDTPGGGRWRYRVRAANTSGVSPWTGWAIPAEPNRLLIIGIHRGEPAWAHSDARIDV